MGSHYWAGVVWAYTDCELTYPTDKLIALSGIARQVQNMLQTDYVAGIWRKDLTDALLWRALQDYTNVYTQSYIAPSWTCASVGRHIFHPVFPQGCDVVPTLAYATIIDVNITLINLDDPLG
jgi:hypothetical protein